MRWWRLLLLLCVLKAGHDASSLRVVRNEATITTPTSPHEHSAAAPSASPVQPSSPENPQSPTSTTTHAVQSAGAPPTAAASATPPNPSLPPAPAPVNASTSANATAQIAPAAAPTATNATAKIAQLNAHMQRAVDTAIQEQNDIQIRQYKVAARVIGQLRELTGHGTSRVRELVDLVSLQEKLRKKAIADARRKLEQAKVAFEKMAAKTMAKIRTEGDSVHPVHHHPAHSLHEHTREHSEESSEHSRHHHAGSRAKHGTKRSSNSKHRSRASGKKQSSTEHSRHHGEEAGAQEGSHQRKPHWHQPRSEGAEQAEESSEKSVGEEASAESSLAEIFGFAHPRFRPDLEGRIRLARRSFEKATASLNDLSLMEDDDTAGLMDHLRAALDENS